MKQIEAVIFDWAGTTVDFGCFAPLNVFIEIFENKGIGITLEETRAPMGMSKKDHVRALLNMPRISALWLKRFGRNFTEDDIDMLYKKFEPSLMKSLTDYTDVLDGVIDTCDWLRANDIKIGSTTGYTYQMMEVVSHEAKTKGYAPDTLVTADKTSGYGRPAPYMIFKNMEMLGVYPPNKVIKVGDTVSDIKEGLNAGTISVGVIVGSSVMGLTQKQYDTLSESEKNVAIDKAASIFKNAGAHHVITTMNQLPDLIKKINAGKDSLNEHT